MDPFLQDPPRPADRLRDDRPLRHALERLLPPDVLAEATPELESMSALALEHLPPLAERAEADRPRHVPYDAWGRRVDRIEVDPAWEELVGIGQEQGLVGRLPPGHDRRGGPRPPQ